MGSIRKRNNYYRAQIRIKGFPERHASFDSKEKAQQWIDSVESSFRNPEEFPRIPLSVFLDRYLKEILPFKNPKYAKKEKVFLSYWREVLGTKSPIEISALEIETYANQIKNRSNQISKSDELVSPETRRKYIMYLAYVFNIAIKKWKWLGTNPASRVDLQDEAIKLSRKMSCISDKTGTEWKKFKRHFIFSVQEALKNKNMPIHAGIELSRFLGLSQSSIQNLFKEDANSNIAVMCKVLSKLDLSIEITCSHETP